MRDDLQKSGEQALLNILNKQIDVFNGFIKLGLMLVASFIAFITMIILTLVYYAVKYHWATKFFIALGG